jgi:predicted DNA-binding protein
VSKQEKLYQPHVKAEHVRRLYQLKVKTGKPMTILINEAVAAYCESAQPNEREEEVR